MENNSDNRESLNLNNKAQAGDNTITHEQNVWSHEKVCGVVSVPGLQYQSKTIFIQCQNCSKFGETEVETKWSIPNVAFCYYCNFFFGIKQLIQGKDRRLMDAIHKCSSCKQVVGEYTAC